jgi:hypothetical protein
MRKKPSEKTIKILFAKSGNKCAFAQCTNSIVKTLQDRELVVCEICHIEGVSPNGPRYNSQLTNLDTSSINNLVLMCHEHHKEIDEFPDLYTVNKLKEIKANHESNQVRMTSLSDESAKILIDEYDNFWTNINLLNSERHQIQNLALELNEQMSLYDLYKDCEQCLYAIQKINGEIDHILDKNWDDLLRFLKQNQIDTQKLEEIPYYLNPFYNQLWELRCIGLSNYFQKLAMDILILTIKGLQFQLLMDKNNLEVRNSLEELQAHLTSLADKVSYVD